MKGVSMWIGSKMREILFIPLCALQMFSKKSQVTTHTVENNTYFLLTIINVNWQCVAV